MGGGGANVHPCNLGEKCPHMPIFIGGGAMSGGHMSVHWVMQYVVQRKERFYTNNIKIN